MAATTADTQESDPESDSDFNPDAAGRTISTQTAVPSSPAAPSALPQPTYSSVSNDNETQTPMPTNEAQTPPRLAIKAATEPQPPAPETAPNATDLSDGFGGIPSALSADETSTPAVGSPNPMPNVGVIAASVSTVIIVLVAAGLLLRSRMKRKMKIVDEKTIPSEFASIPPEGSSFNLLNFATARGGLKFNQQGPIPATQTWPVQLSRLLVSSGNGQIVSYSEPEPPATPQNALTRVASVMTVASNSSRGETREGLLPDTNFPEFFCP